jgi:hypothetical protein
VKVASSPRVGESTGQRDELATDGLGDERSLGLKSEHPDPTHQVVGDWSEHGLGSVAIALYTEIIAWLGDGDPTTRRMFEEILAMEEERAEDMLALLDGLN